MTAQLALYLMILAHFLYDFHWQGDYIAANKGKFHFIMAVHSLTWGMIVYLPLMYFAKNFDVVLLFGLISSHYGMDFIKSMVPVKRKNFYVLYIDQAVHIISIIYVFTIGITGTDVVSMIGN